MNVTSTPPTDESRTLDGRAFGVPMASALRADTFAQWLQTRQARALATLLVIGVVLGVRLFRLDGLQNEVYGDIHIVLNYVAEIRAGSWPTHFELSAGPLYHYVIMPVVLVAGANYYGLKLASVLVSLGALLATYGVARRLLGAWFALLAAFVAGTGSWLLVFSRLGNSQILVPLLAMVGLYGVLLIVQRGHWADYAGCALVGALGLYTYPQSFVLPLVLLATLLCLRWSGHPVRWRGLGLFALVTLVGALPFVRIVSRDPYNFFSGYIGGKLLANGDTVATLASNVVRALGALHVRGDVVYRSNPTSLPELDPLSGVLFLVGIVFWLRPARRRWAALLLVPLLLLQVPSMLVLSSPEEVPSASRALAVAPLAAILVASAIWWIGTAVLARRAHLGAALVLVALAALLGLNMQRYFVSYIHGLPYQNTQLGRSIATYADMLAPETNVYIIGCCWGDGMPETPYVQDMARTGKRIYELGADTNCTQLAALKQPAALVWSFAVPVPPPLQGCAGWLPAQTFVSAEGQPVFNAAPLYLPRVSP